MYLTSSQWKTYYSKNIYSPVTIGEKSRSFSEKDFSLQSLAWPCKYDGFQTNRTMTIMWWICSIAMVSNGLLNTRCRSFCPLSWRLGFQTLSGSPIPKYWTRTPSLQIELPTRLEVEFAPWISKEQFLKTGSDKCGQFVILKLYKLRTYFSWKLSLQVSSVFQLASETTNVRECATILSRAARAWLLRGTACTKANEYSVVPISYDWVSKGVLSK